MWHFLKILGEASKLLCQCTNKRAKRSLSKCSADYTKKWKDLKDGPVFWTFMAVYLGTAILGVGPRHLMNSKPHWITQKGPNKLFEKIPGYLFRM